MVERGIRKDVFNHLAGLKVEVLLLALSDERFNLYVKGGRKASSEEF